MVSGKAALDAYGLRKRTTTNKIKHFRFRRRHNLWSPHNRPTQLTGTQRAERVWRATSGDRAQHPCCARSGSTRPALRCAKLEVLENDIKPRLDGVWESNVSRVRTKIGRAHV